MLLQIAWKNIWRNKVRSSVILLAISLGIAAGMFNLAFYNGMFEQRVQTAIKTEASHVQIHHPEYLANPELQFLIDDANHFASNIQDISTVSNISARLISSAMVASAETGSGIKLIGINAEQEALVTDINKRVIEGEYLEGIKRNPILIGEKLASKLKVKLRSKVVITLQNTEGEMTNASFRVAGIYKTSNTTYDEMNAFVRSEDLRTLLGVAPNSAHEIAILLNSNESLDVTTSEIKTLVPQYEVKTWLELMPEVNMMQSSMNMAMYIFMSIILFALIFGIINTMLMAVLERRKELGMLMAIGMNKKRVFKMISLETVLLSLVGGVVGIIIGGLFTFITSRSGIQLESMTEGYESMGFETLVYPSLSVGMALQVVFMVLITGAIASLYPARKALKLKPVEAIRME